MIDKLSDGIGWTLTKETPSKIAVNTYIKDIKNSNYDPLTKAALISKAKKTIKEYCNQQDIIKIAIDYMTEYSKPENIDADWLIQFMDKARLVSDKEFQFIWGKILTEECNQSDSIPKSLLHILEQMDKHDALTFSAICSVSVFVENDDIFVPVIIESRFRDFYASLGITYDKLVDLQALGLISMTIAEGQTYTYTVESDEAQRRVRYFDHIYQLPSDRKSIDTGGVIFTKAGYALCKAINVHKIDNFWDDICLPYLQQV